MTWTIKNLVKKQAKGGGTYYRCDAEFACEYKNLADEVPVLSVNRIVYFPSMKSVNLPYYWAGRGNKKYYCRLERWIWDILTKEVKLAVAQFIENEDAGVSS